MIVIPDIHGRQFWRYAIKQCAGQEHIVFLGDYLDPYRDEGITNDEAFEGLQDIIKLKEEHQDNITLLLGNHDLHYLYERMQGSRYDVINASRYRRVFEDNFDLFQMAYEAEIGGRNYLFSHAGILPGWIQENEFLFGSIESRDLTHYLNMLWWTRAARRPLFEALSDVSYARWGTCRFGSMVWADVMEHSVEQEEVPGYYQVFGHTKVEDPVITPHFACLDCQRSFWLKDDGEFITY